MIGLKVTPNGWLQEVDVPVDGIAALLHCGQPARQQLHHNIDLWHDQHYADREDEANMAAIGILLNNGDHNPNTVPLIGGDVVLLGADPTTGRPRSLARDQYLQLGNTLLATLNA